MDFCCTLLAVLLAMVSSPVGMGTAKPAAVIDSWRGDLDGDGTTELVEITCISRHNGHPVGGDVIVRQRVGSKSHVVWRHGGLNPWKLQVGDVDGDRRKDIVVGVWKKSPKDPVFAKRSFVYSWNGRRLMPMWLGSRLSRRFDDFALADADGDGLAELFALEILPGGEHRIAEYRWRSFGFDWLGCTGKLEGVTGLHTTGGRIMILRTGGSTTPLDLASIR